jgi:hypothetical protein
VEVETNRISCKTQERLYTALRIILERPPSDAIEEMARKLTKWASEYSEEKKARFPRRAMPSVMLLSS